MDRNKWQAQMAGAEGDRPLPYDDATGQTVTPGTTVKGNVSIGIGRNLLDGLSPAERAFLFSNDTDTVEDDLTANFGWWSGLDDVRQRAFAEMRFNLGHDGFRAFHQTIADAVAKDWDATADQVMTSAAARELPARYARIAAWIRTGVESATPAVGRAS